MINKLLLMIFCVSLFIGAGCDSVKSDRSLKDEQGAASVSFEKAAIAGYRNLAPQEFMENFRNDENAILIDVRTPEEIKDGKLEGALEYNYSDPSFGKTILNLEKNGHYYIYCASGIRSAKTARMMVENGFSSVTNMNGSIDELKDK